MRPIGSESGMKQLEGFQYTCYAVCDLYMYSGLIKGYNIHVKPTIFDIKVCWFLIGCDILCWCHHRPIVVTVAGVLAIVFTSDTWNC